MSAINQIINKFESMALKQPDDDKKTLKEQNAVKKTFEEHKIVKKTSGEHGNVEKTGNSKSLLDMPDELLLEIGSSLNAVDNGNVRLVNKMLCNPFRDTFYKALPSEFTVYPRYESFHHLFSPLNGDAMRGLHVRKLVLVQDGLVAPRNDYGWYWEELENTTESRFTVDDWNIIRNINDAHRCDIYNNGEFLTAGVYRSYLTSLLMLLPNLEIIEVRHLRAGEHLIGWDGPELMRQLSIYHDGLYDRNMFYGGWLYDEIQKRVTIYMDEFGEVIEEPGAGPQATFKEDLECAHHFSGTRAAIIT